MTSALKPLAALLAAVLVLLGAGAAVGSSGASAPAQAPAADAVVIVQTPPQTIPAGPAPAATVGPETVRAAVRTARRTAPDARITVRAVTGPLDARSAVAQAAGRDALVVGSGPDVQPALALARAEWPEARVLAAD